MDIYEISKERSEVTVKLSKDDLVNICNSLYLQFDKNKNNIRFLQLYSDMMMIRDLCQYGHIDNFCLDRITECRNIINNLANKTESSN